MKKAKRLFPPSVTKGPTMADIRELHDRIDSLPGPENEHLTNFQTLGAIFGIGLTLMILLGLLILEVA